MTKAWRVPWSAQGFMSIAGVRKEASPITVTG